MNVLGVFLKNGFQFSSLSLRTNINLFEENRVDTDLLRIHENSMWCITRRNFRSGEFVVQDEGNGI